MNRDRGRHTLSAIYREIIQSRDPITTSESRDDATSQKPADEGDRMVAESFCLSLLAVSNV